MTPDRGIYLTCDNHPRMLYQLTKCVEGIRQHGCSLPVHAIIVGEIDRGTADFLKHNSVNIMFRGWRDYPRFVRTELTFLKWFPPKDAFDHEELLYLDTDTFAFRNVTELFEAVGPEDFHARRSHQAHEANEIETVGLALVEPPGRLPRYLSLYRALQTNLRIDPVLGFNSGTMLFKHGVHKRLLQQPDLIRRIRNMFVHGLLPYPLPHPYLIDELVGRIALGAVGGVSNRAMPPELCPFYVDTFHSLGAAPGILTHTFAAFYAHFLFTRFGKDTCQRYLALSRHPDSGKLIYYPRWVWLKSINVTGITRIGLSLRCAVARTLLHTQTGPPRPPSP